MKIMNFIQSEREIMKRVTETNTPTLKNNVYMKKTNKRITISLYTVYT